MNTKPFSGTWDCPLCHALCGERVESCSGGIDIHDPEAGDPTHKCDVCGGTQSLPHQLKEGLPCEKLAPLALVLANCHGMLRPWPVNDETHPIVYRPEYVECLVKQRAEAFQLIKVLGKVVEVQTRMLKTLRLDLDLFLEDIRKYKQLLAVENLLDKLIHERELAASEPPCSCPPRLTVGQWFIAAGVGIVLGLVIVCAMNLMAGNGLRLLR